MYEYDALNRRIRRKVDTDGNGSYEVNQRLLYDTNVVDPSYHEVVQIIEGSDETDITDLTREHRFLNGPYPDMVLVDEVFTSSGTPDDILWLLHDHQNTVTGVATIPTSGSAQLENHIEYDAFGVITSQSDSNYQPLQTYTGQIQDDATGLLYYDARWFDPTINRFVSEDPIGFAGGDANLRRYVGNSTPNATDPSGLARLPIENRDKGRYWEGLDGSALTGKHVRENGGNGVFVFPGSDGRIRRVPFYDGRPDYTDSFSHSIRVPHHSTSDADIRDANRRWKSIDPSFDPDAGVWHHAAYCKKSDSHYLIFVPKDIHNTTEGGVAHEGSRHDAKQRRSTPVEKAHLPSELLDEFAESSGQNPDRNPRRRKPPAKRSIDGFATHIDLNGKITVIFAGLAIIGIGQSMQAIGNEIQAPGNKAVSCLLVGDVAGAERYLFGGTEWIAGVAGPSGDSVAAIILREFGDAQTAGGMIRAHEAFLERMRKLRSDPGYQSAVEQEKMRRSTPPSIPPSTKSTSIP